MRYEKQDSDEYSKQYSQYTNRIAATIFELREGQVKEQPSSGLSLKNTMGRCVGTYDNLYAKSISTIDLYLYLRHSRSL